MQRDLLVEAYDPFRKPTWKWDLAAMIHDRKLDRERYPDPAVLAAVDYLAGSLKGQVRQSIAAAEELYRLDSPRRWEVEARLLAGQSDEEIAAETGFGPGIIHWFEALFFYVRDALDRTDYLMCHVIGFGHVDGFKDSEVRAFWFWLAANGGPSVLDELIDGFVAVHHPQDRPQLSRYFHRGSPVRIDLQAFVAYQMIPLTEQTAMFLAYFGRRLAEAGTFGRNEQTPQRLYHDAIDAARKFLAGEPLSVPEPDADRVQQDGNREIAGQRGSALAVLMSSLGEADDRNQECQIERVAG